MTPQFKIHGNARREKKKELFELKTFLKNFWFDHQMDKDMASFYGSTDTFPMSDEKAQKMFDEKSKQMEKLEKELKAPYSSQIGKKKR